MSQLTLSLICYAVLLPIALVIVWIVNRRRLAMGLIAVVLLWPVSSLAAIEIQNGVLNHQFEKYCDEVMADWNLPDLTLRNMLVNRSLDISPVIATDIDYIDFSPSSPGKPYSEGRPYLRLSMMPFEGPRPEACETTESFIENQFQRYPNHFHRVLDSGETQFACIIATPLQQSDAQYEMVPLHYTDDVTLPPFGLHLRFGWRGVVDRQTGERVAHIAQLFQPLEQKWGTLGGMFTSPRSCSPRQTLNTGLFFEPLDPRFQIFQ